MGKEQQRRGRGDGGRGRKRVGGSGGRGGVRPSKRTKVEERNPRRVEEQDDGTGEVGEEELTEDLTQPLADFLQGADLTSDAPRGRRSKKEKRPKPDQTPRPKEDQPEDEEQAPIEDQEEQEEVDREPEVEVEGPLSELATAQDRRERLVRQREAMARICEAALSCGDTLRLFPLLKKLQGMCGDEDQVVSNLATLSLAAVFRDVIPDYQIRLDRAKEMDEAESRRHVMVSKKVADKRGYERSLVMAYREFLAHLEATFKAVDAGFRKRSSVKAGPGDADLAKELAAIKAVCGLAAAKPQFNFKENLMSMLVGRMTSPRKAVSEECCKCVTEIFRSDSSGGQVPLDIVRRLGKALKNCHYDVSPRVLEPFVELKLSREIIKPLEVEGDAPVDKKDRTFVNKKQRKIYKAEKVLKKEFKEAQATYTADELRRTQTAILDSVFATYFRVIVKAAKSPLVAVVLKGVAKFASMINVEFMSDIVRAVEDLMDDPDLPPKLAFHGATAVFAAMRSQGYCVDVDVSDFYAGVYKVLTATPLDPSPETGPALVQALDSMLAQQRGLPIDRVAAFCKRMSTVGLLSLAPETSLGVLAVLSAVLEKYPRTQGLTLGVGAGAAGGVSGGRFLAELDEPDHTNPWASALWELAALHVLPHYHPQVARAASQLLGGTQLELSAVSSAHELTTSLRGTPDFMGLTEESLESDGAPRKKSSEASRGCSGPSDWLSSLLSRATRTTEVDGDSLKTFYREICVHRRLTQLQIEKHRLMMNSS